MDDLREAKKKLRRQCFAAVRELGDERKAEFSRAICAHLKEWPVFREAKSVGVYIAVKSEPDLSELIWNSPEKTMLLARIGDDEALHFHRIKTEADLVIGDFGIAEPNPETCPAVMESELDLVIVPGVGFDDLTGARLGRGKGHYDRFLERLRDGDGSARLVVGVSFSIQHVEVTAEAHDQPMDFVVSELGIQTVA